MATCGPQQDLEIDLGDDTGDHRVPIPVTGDPEVVLEAVDAVAVDVVAVASDPDLSGHTVRRLGWALDERGVDLIVSPGIVEVAGPRLSIRPVAGPSLLHLEPSAVTGGRVQVKTVVERLLALVLLIVAIPLLAAVAIAIRLGSPGPVMFRQERIGAHGHAFSMLKFRSMTLDAEALRPELERRHDASGPLFKLRDDPRITQVGGALRRFSLDELPQLWNVLRGEMSLVGPRPPCRRRRPGTTATPPVGSGSGRG